MANLLEKTLGKQNGPYDILEKDISRKCFYNLTGPKSFGLGCTNKRFETTYILLYFKKKKIN